MNQLDLNTTVREIKWRGHYLVCEHVDITNSIVEDRSSGKRYAGQIRKLQLDKCDYQFVSEKRFKCLKLNVLDKLKDLLCLNKYYYSYIQDKY